MDGHRLIAVVGRRQIHFAIVVEISCYRKIATFADGERGVETESAAAIIGQDDQRAVYRVIGSGGDNQIRLAIAVHIGRYDVTRAAADG